MKELVRYLKKIAMIIALAPLKVLRTKQDLIILDNCLAHNYADNIKPIAQQLLARGNGRYTIYLAVLDTSKYEHLTELGITPVRYHSFKYYTVAMTAGFVITNSGGYSYLPLKKNQRVINTWHGGGAYKKIGVDAYNTTNFYRHELRLAAKKTSLFTATGTLFADLISKALLIPRNVFAEVGMPRNDILVNGAPEIERRVRANIGLEEGEHLVLYAPTYRRKEGDSFGQSVAIEYGIDTDRVCRSLEKRFGGTWRFAVRLHPQIKEVGAEFDKPSIINLTEYPDMQELLLAADVMINDFSSTLWDYMLTGKPCFLYAKDLQEYIDTTAVYTPVSSWPFPKSTTNDELEQTIIEFDEESYKRNCQKHYEDLGGCETGRASEYVCDYIDSIIDQWGRIEK